MGTFMFDQGHQVGYNNYKALIQVLYLSIDLRRLPPLGMRVGKFITKLEMKPSPPQEVGFGTSHQGVLLSLGDPQESSEVQGIDHLLHGRL